MYLVDAEKDFKNRHNNHHHPKSLSKKVEDTAIAAVAIAAGVDVDYTSHPRSKCTVHRELLFNPFSRIIGFRRNMAATDGQIILAASRFGDITPAYLRDFPKPNYQRSPK